MIRGYWHPKGSAARFSATFEVNDLQRYDVTLEDGTIYRGDATLLEVSDRLGNVERKIKLEDGSVFTRPFQNSWQIRNQLH